MRASGANGRVMAEQAAEPGADGRPWRDEQAGHGAETHRVRVADHAEQGRARMLKASSEALLQDREIVGVQQARHDADEAD